MLRADKQVQPKKDATKREPERGWLRRAGLAGRALVLVQKRDHFLRGHVFTERAKQALLSSHFRDSAHASSLVVALGLLSRQSARTVDPPINRCGRSHFGANRQESHARIQSQLEADSDFVLLRRALLRPRFGRVLACAVDHHAHEQAAQVAARLLPLAQSPQFQPLLVSRQSSDFARLVADTRLVREEAVHSVSLVFRQVQFHFFKRSVGYEVGDALLERFAQRRYFGHDCKKLKFAAGASLKAGSLVKLTREQIIRSIQTFDQLKSKIMEANASDKLISATVFEVGGSKVFENWRNRQKMQGLTGHKLRNNGLHTMQSEFGNFNRVTTRFSHFKSVISA